MALATGRSSTFTQPIFEYLNLGGLSIVQNGALIVDGLTQEVLWEKQIKNMELLKMPKQHEETWTRQCITMCLGGLNQKI